MSRLKATLDFMEEGPRKEVQAGAKADMEAAQADLDKAKWNLDNCECVARSGIVLKKDVQEGQHRQSVGLCRNRQRYGCIIADMATLLWTLKWT